MSRCFPSVEAARAHFAHALGIPEGDVREIESGPKVAGFAELLLDPNDESDAAKLIRSESERIQRAQRSFEARSPVTGEMCKCVIGPFRNGFDCWLVASNGRAIRA